MISQGRESVESVTCTLTSCTPSYISFSKIKSRKSDKATSISILNSDSHQQVMQRMQITSGQVISVTPAILSVMRDVKIMLSCPPHEIGRSPSHVSPLCPLPPVLCGYYNYYNYLVIATGKLTQGTPEHQAQDLNTNISVSHSPADKTSLLSYEFHICRQARHCF